MTTQRFSSGKEAMSWLTRGESPAGKGARLDREISESLAGKAPRARKAAKPARARGGNMTLAQFMASLPSNLNTRSSGVTVPTVAKQIRADIAAAIDAGVLPSGTKASVTSDHNSIRIDITRWDGQVFTNKYLEHLMDPSIKWDPERDYERNDARLTPELNRAIKAIEKIANRHNFDESDSMTDYFHVGYYLTVDARSVIDTAENGIKQETNKEYRELLTKARIAAKALGPAATKSITGAADPADGYPTSLEHLIKVAERAKGRPVEYDKRRRGWFPV